MKQTKTQTNVVAIGSTRYKQVDYSPVSSSVFVKTKLDKNYRQMQEFTGGNASVRAYEFIFNWVNS